MADFFEDQNNAQGLGLLGGAVKGFAQGLMQAEDFADRREDRKMKRLEFEAKMYTDKYKREKDEADKDFDNRLNARKAGLIVPEKGQPFDPGTAQFDPKWVEMQTGLRQAGAGADPYGTKALAAQTAQQSLIKAKEDREEKLRRRNAVPIEGYQKTENYVADPVEERQLRGGNVAVQNFSNQMDTLKQKLQGVSKVDLANPYSNARKAIEKDLRNLQLLYKSDEFAKLGVLTGPDLSLLEQIIENPSSISNLISGKQGVLDRYEELKNSVKSNWNNKVQSYGLVPVGLVPQTAGQNGLIKATTRPAPTGQIKVSNGKESFFIDPKDLKDAERDGFRRAN